jgi:hypothetical protein
MIRNLGHHKRDNKKCRTGLFPTKRCPPTPADINQFHLIVAVFTEGPPLLFAEDLLLGAQFPSWHYVVG